MMRRAAVDVFFLLSAIAALLLLMIKTVVNAQDAPAAATAAAGVHYTCAYTPLQLDELVTLEHVQNKAEGTFSMRLTYTGGLAWVAIGVNAEGGTKMVPATAVIGRMEYDVDDITPIGSSVLQYNLLTDAEDGSGVAPMARELQTLMDANFEQSDDGTQTSVLTFTQRLDEYLGLAGASAGGVISDDTSWLYAVGLPDNQWEGKHTVYGSFSIRLEDNCLRMNVRAPDEVEVVTDGGEDTNTALPMPPEEDNEEEEQQAPPAEQEPLEPESPVVDADPPDETSVGFPDETAVGFGSNDVQEPESEQQQSTAGDNVDADADSGGSDNEVQDPELDPEQQQQQQQQQPTADDNADADLDDGSGMAVEEEEEEPAVANVVNYDCSFVEPREIYANKLKLEHYKNTAAGTYTMRLTYLKGSAWVSIGVNHEGSFHMAPSTCIIGRIEYAEDAITPIGSSVLKYDVTNTKKDASGVTAMAEELQTLMDTTFEQDGETSVLTFTQKLVDSGMDDQPITDESSWIFAVGLPDNQWEGSHKVHGSFFLPLEENCMAPVIAAPVPVVASATGQARGSGLVMREDVTETTFPLWVAHGWFMAIAWGLVGPLAIGSAMLRRLVGSNWYKIHFYLNMMCVVMTIVGFGLAVSAIKMEQKPHFTPKTSPDDQGQVHHNAGLAIFIIVILQSVAGYFRPPVVAPPRVETPSAVEKEAKQLDDDGDKQQKPNLKRLDTRKTETEGETSHGKVRFEDDEEDTPEAVETRAAPSNEGSNETSDLEGSQDSPAAAVADATPAQQKLKSPCVRKLWEMQHRLIGAVVVGLAWYNCHSGYQLMGDTYDETQNYTVLFWSVTGVIAGSIFVLAYVARV